MAIDHTERIKGVVKAALKEAAMGEPFGCFAAFCFAPQYAQVAGKSVMAGIAPAWFVTVTIRNTGLGQPDIGNGKAVYGILPDDAILSASAVELLADCRTERDQMNAQSLQQVGMDLTKALERRN